MCFWSTNKPHLRVLLRCVLMCISKTYFDVTTCLHTCAWGAQGGYLGKKIHYSVKSSSNPVPLHIHLIWECLNRSPSKTSAQKWLILACYALKLSYPFPSISCMTILLLNRRLHYLSALPLPQCGSALCWTPAHTHLSHNFHAYQHLHTCRSDNLRHDS